VLIEAIKRRIDVAAAGGLAWPGAAKQSEGSEHHQKESFSADRHFKIL
jgi:hypothetical protein